MAWVGKPERGVDGPHRLIDDAEQTVTQLDKVDFGAELGAEG